MICCALSAGSDSDQALEGKDPGSCSWRPVLCCALCGELCNGDSFRRLRLDGTRRMGGRRALGALPGEERPLRRVQLSIRSWSSWGIPGHRGVVSSAAGGEHLSSSAAASGGQGLRWLRARLSEASPTGDTGDMERKRHSISVAVAKAALASPSCSFGSNLAGVSSAQGYRSSRRPSLSRTSPP